jgi:hypothetical protein
MGREGDVNVSLRRSTILGVSDDDDDNDDDDDDDDDEYDRDDESWTREVVFVLERRTLFLVISTVVGHAVRNRRREGLMATRYRVR